MFLPSLHCFRTVAILRNEKRQLCGMGPLIDNVYQLDGLSTLQSPFEQPNEMDMWHQCLRHLNEHHLRDIVKKEIVTGVKIPKTSSLSFCEGCVEGKMHHSSKPFKLVGATRSK